MSVLPGKNKVSDACFCKCIACDGFVKHYFMGIADGSALLTNIHCSV